MCRRDGIWILDLEAPNPTGTAFPLVNISANQHHSYNNVRCEWHTFRSHGEYIIASIGSSMQLFNLKSAERAKIVHDRHSRTITDIEWSFLDPNVLASASVDSFVKLWDLRQFEGSANKPIYHVHYERHPVQSIVWNRKNEFTFASLHGDKVNVWDRRGGATPLLSLQMDSVISSIDWSHLDSNKLLIHDTNGNISIMNTDTKHPHVYPQKIVSAKTRFTPFGDGIIWAYRNEIGLMSLKHSRYEIITVPGDANITEYAWRVAAGDIKLDGDDRQFKLLATGTNGILREIMFAPHLFQMIGHGGSERSTIPNTKQRDPVHDFVSTTKGSLNAFPTKPFTAVRSTMNPLKYIRKNVHDSDGKSHPLPTSLYKSLENMAKNPKMIGKLEEKLFLDGSFKGIWFSGTAILSIRTKTDAKKDDELGINAFAIKCRMVPCRSHSSILNAAFMLSTFENLGTIDVKQHQYAVEMIHLLSKISPTSHPVATSLLSRLAIDTSRINDVPLFLIISLLLQNVKREMPVVKQEIIRRNGIGALKKLKLDRLRVPQSFAYKLKARDFSSKGAYIKTNVFKDEIVKQAEKQFKDILLRNRMFEYHAELEKDFPSGIDMFENKDVIFKLICAYCGNSLYDDNTCGVCKRKGSDCTICGLPTDEFVSFCSGCNHGGHVKHMLKWFSRNEECPTGCGCACRTFT